MWCVQFYDAPHQLHSNAFLTRRLALPLEEARQHLQAPVNASDPSSATRCPLAPARIDALLDPYRNEFSKPGAFCRYVCLLVLGRWLASLKASCLGAVMFLGFRKEQPTRPQCSVIPCSRQVAPLQPIKKLRSSSLKLATTTDAFRTSMYSAALQEWTAEHTMQPTCWLVTAAPPRLACACIFMDLMAKRMQVTYTRITYTIHFVVGCACAQARTHHRQVRVVQVHSA